MNWNNMKKYQIIYADPPWSYNSRRAKYIKNNSAETAKHYSTLSLERIKKLPILNLISKNCILFLWATFPQLQEALDVISAWGFKYKTIGFCWIKTTKDGSNPAFGVGAYTRSNAEICLLAIKGKRIREKNNISSIIISPREKHSKKPDIIRNKIIELCGDIPRLELFARQKTEGWDIWGNEVKSDINL